MQPATTTMKLAIYSLHFLDKQVCAGTVGTFYRSRIEVLHQLLGTIIREIWDVFGILGQGEHFGINLNRRRTTNK